MEKESYNIDDILSEVKKRREEKQNAPESSDTHAEHASKKEIFNLGTDKKETSDEEVVIQIPIDEPSAAQESREEDGESDAGNTARQENGILIEEEESTRKEVSPNEEKASGGESNSQSREEDDGMVDLLSLADREDLFEEKYAYEEEPVKENFFKTKKGKVTITAIVILVFLIIAAVVFGILYANDALNKVTQDGEDYEKVTYYNGMDFLQEDFPAINEVSADEITGYKEYLKQWYLNGDPVSSTHILNVLLIGQDTREEKISNASRADSAIIVSVNIDTKQLTMTSVLRDMYVYYEVDGNGMYGKINESAANGGIKTYINTVERYFKISIDNYVIVNFASFPKIIDTQGGIEIPITPAEVREVNNHPKRYAKATLPDAVPGENGEYQRVKLNGKQALAYCRIRYIDSDNARADRQKAVLLELFKKMKGAGKIDTVKTVNSMIGYVVTGYSKKEIVSIANTAMKDGWLNFKTVTNTVPNTENASGGSKFAVAPKNWIWKVDFPKDACELQNEIYGKSNINLNENRAQYLQIDY